ncbi:MAG: P-II family nitrogen regulator [Candidatus Omnitrophica bacterium]|nr:Nitrogen regulatory protein P-II [bacterium]NUN95871.1 P-II family nitrogen regulator [Candidatus Omnitrophota bacterium]
MKIIVAVIRPSKVESVKAALEEAGIRGLTISEVRGHGRQKGHKEIFRGKEYSVDMLPKARLEVAVTDTQVEGVVQALIESARTGDVGDGKIFILPMENAYRIRTGETGVDAI